MEEKKLCPICGEPTFKFYGNYRKDGLCSKHATMLKNGELTVSDDGKFVFAEKDKEETKNDEPQKLNKYTTPCIVCGNHPIVPWLSKFQCKNCYSETLDFIEELDKNGTIRDTRDHYYNLKERLLIMNTLEKTQKNCNRLIAIAIVAAKHKGDNSLMDRVYKDVTTFIEKRKAYLKENAEHESEKEKDETKEKVCTAQDGHIVDSDMEVRIDDLLSSSFILHSYGISVNEITEARKKCDWFIPISNGKGIYIEYWGVKNSQKYKDDREEKTALYKKHNLPLISIEADDPKQDTSTFKQNLLRDLRKLAEEHYGFMPEWKK